MTRTYIAKMRRAAGSVVIILMVTSNAALAGAPPSGEPPRQRLQREPGGPDQATKGQPKAPLLSIANRQAMLSDLYGQLAKTADPRAAQPLLEAIWKTWTFSGSATSDVLLERARAAASEGKADETLVFLDTVTELQPDFAQGWFLRAMTHKLKNDSHRMLGDLRRALALDPRHIEALKALAFELNERGQKKAAIDAYNKLLEGFPAAAKSDDPVLENLSRALGGQGI